MGVLIRSQLRLVWGSVALWTLLGAVVSAFTSGRLSIVGEERPPEGLFLTILAAALGPRLFATETAGGQGAYLRALPIPAARLAAIKLAVGAGAILLATLVLAALGGLDVARLWMPERSFHVPPSWSGWGTILEMCAVVFAASAYLTCSFERVLASNQAGFAAWFAAVYLLRAGEELGLLHGGGSLGSLAVTAIGLGAAYRLFARRGVGIATAEEKVLGDPRPLDALLTVPAQLLFVVLPLGYVAYGLPEDVAPYLPVGQATIAGALWLALGLLLVPWSLRQIRARDLGPAAATGVLLLNLTGLGAFFWKSVRGKGPVARCSTCGRRRRVALARCPRCSAHAITRVERERWRGLRLPCTPFGWALALILASTSWIFWLGGYRFFHGWEVVAGDPDAWILRDGEVIGRGRAAGFVIGPRIESTPATMSMYAAFQSELPFAVSGEQGSVEELSIADLIEGLEAQPDAGLRVDRQLCALFPDGARFTLRVDGTTTRVRSPVRGTNATRAGTTGLSLDLDAVHPELEARVEALADELADPTCTNERILALGDTSNAFLQAFQRGEVPPRVRFEFAERVERDERTFVVVRPVALPLELRAGRQAAQHALDVLLRRRYGLDGAAGRSEAEIAGAIWAELDDRLSRVPALAPVEDSSRLFELQQTLFPQLRALALAHSSPAAGHETLLRRLRTGDPIAALVAGSSGDQALFDPLARAYGQAESPSWAEAARDETNRAGPFLLASAWALLALDRERGMEVLLERFVDDPEPAALELFAVSGDARAADAVERWLALPDGALARRLQLRNRRAVEHVRVRLRAVQLGLEWELEPVDWRENFTCFALTRNVRAAQP